MMISTTNDADVIEAINHQRLVAWSATADNNAATAAAATCAAIARTVEAELDEVLQRLADQSIDATLRGAIGPRQRHTADLDVASYATAVRAADALAEVGFTRWDDWTNGAGESFRRVATELTVARTAAVTFVIRFRWGATRTRGRLARVFSPTRGDWAMIDLPRSLWWGYSLLRPVRIVAERLGRRDPHDAGLGPYLSTPESLITPLFDVAELTADDVLLDIGCGDGRLPLAAARSVGCRSIGVELEAGLTRCARQAVADASLDELVTIEHGDARTVDLSNVTVVFMFLPMDVVGRLVPDVLETLPAGARLIVHEQTALPASAAHPPDTSTAIIADDAVTVAHVWVRDAAQGRR